MSSNVPMLMGLAAALLAAGCTSSGSASMQNALQADDYEFAHLNPAPRQAYEAILTIFDAPGPFAEVEGYAQYDVVNEWECGHIDLVRGTPDRITNVEPFLLKKISDSEYRGVFYLDRMQDEAYFDRDVCRWEFTGIHARLRATKAKEDTRFLPRLSKQAVLAEGAATIYFWKGGYPRDEIDDYPDSGYTDINRFKPAIRNDLFSITLTARKVFSITLTARKVTP